MYKAITYSTQSGLSGRLPWLYPHFFSGQERVQYVWHTGRSPLWRDNDVRQFCAPRKLGKGAGREWLVVVSLFVLFVLHRLAASPLALQEAQALPDGLMHCTWVEESIIESNPPSCRWLYWGGKNSPSQGVKALSFNYHHQTSKKKETGWNFAPTFS